MEARVLGSQIRAIIIIRIVSKAPYMSWSFLLVVIHLIIINIVEPRNVPRRICSEVHLVNLIEGNVMSQVLLLLVTGTRQPVYEQSLIINHVVGVGGLRLETFDVFPEGFVKHSVEVPVA